MDLDDAIKKYLDKGFGSMNKNDFEVFIFGRLLDTTLKNQTDFQISRFLRIPQTKVKRLRYESSLIIEIDHSSKFKEVLKQARIKANNSVFQFAVEDISLRRYLDDLLKKDGRFYDSSFNSEIISISEDDLVYLEEQIFSAQEKESLESSWKRDLLKKNAKDIIQEFLRAMGKNVGNRLIDLSFSAMITWIQTKC